MLTNLKDYLNETINSSALKDQVYLTAKQIAKSIEAGSTGENAIDTHSKALAKLYGVRVASVKKMIQDKVNVLTK